ncbi:MAG: DUF4249 domain-containing protein [Cytophagales bacterium]|nr:DUF4249 domain-containing protein [Cytophagales bacterium]
MKQIQFWKRRGRKVANRGLTVIVLLWMSCIDPVDLSLPPSQLPLIIDGAIADGDGPFSVRILRGVPVDGRYHQTEFVAGARVVISDNTGVRDTLKDIGGIYETNSIKGIVGRTYQLRVTTADGAKYESTPEMMLPAGTVDSVFFEFVRGLKKDTQIEVDGFNIFINATAPAGGNRRLRWKFNGTYKVRTNPALLTTTDPITLQDVPLACAEQCLCCVCWVSVKEESPILFQNDFLGSSTLRHVFVNYIPINNMTFNERYRVEISQMEVSQRVYDFYSGVRKQIDGSTSLFQPPFFELKGNVSATNNDNLVIGVFSAAAVVKRHIYIARTAIPYDFHLSEIIGDCRAVAPNSSNSQPAFWQ